MDNYYSTISKDTLVNSQGIKYYDYLKTLKPKYSVLWIQLLSGHAALILIGWVCLNITTHNLPVAVIGVLACGFFFGYTVAYIMLFFHEAAHYNLTPSRKLNDTLANIFIGLLVGQHIKDYRPIHWGHHRFHGQTTDPEHAYFDPLNITFLVECLFGVYTLKVVGGRKKNLKILAKPEDLAPAESKLILTGGLLINSSLLAISILNGYWLLALSWVIGMIIFFPFFAALRPILEHRDEHADSKTDYFKVPHGIINRLFGDGPVASTLGGAGFNRHLLHHIEPKVSYTRLKDFENYLLDTQFKDEIKKHQTTYWTTLSNLVEF